MSAIDEQLLETLAASLGPAPDVEPTWAEVAALHRVIDSAADRQRRPAVGPIWRFRRRATAIAAAGAVLVGASAAAAATGGALPRPLRMAARAVGLPVESPNLASARSALARLRGSLGARPRDLGDVREQAQDVRDRLAHLSADDRAHVEAEATFLLAEADAVLAPPPAPLGGTPPIAPPAAGAPTPASPKASPADDHGSRAAPAADGHGSGGETASRSSICRVDSPIGIPVRADDAAMRNASEGSLASGTCKSSTSSCPRNAIPRSTC